VPDSPRTDDARTRAVSEVVGFVLVFTLVIGTITFVYTTGFAGLTDTRDVEQVNNAERAFDVLANGFQKMARGEAPSRATEIQLADAQLSTGNYHNVSVHNAAGDRLAAINRSRPIVYEAPGGARVVYEHGAVIRVGSDGSAIVKRGPDFIIGENETIIRYIQVDSQGGDSLGVGGETTVLVRSRKTVSELEYRGESVGDVTFRLRTTPERSPAWESYLDEQIPASGDCVIEGSNNQFVACTFTTDSLSVARTKLRIEFS
jgi:hypothetical protein